MNFYDLEEATVGDLASQKNTLFRTKGKSTKYFRLFLRSYSVVIFCLSVEYEIS